LFFVKPGVKVNGQYKWDILLSQEMLDAIKHITDDIFFFQEDSAQVHSRLPGSAEVQVI